MKMSEKQINDFLLDIEVRIRKENTKDLEEIDVQIEFRTNENKEDVLCYFEQKTS